MITVEFDSAYKIHRACETDDGMRPVLTGVFVHPLGYLWATNGFIAAQVPAIIKGAPDGWAGAIVPFRIMEAAVKSRKETGGLARIEIDPKGGFASTVTNMNYLLRGLLIKGQFPSVAKAIPKRENLVPCGDFGLTPMFLEAVMRAVGMTTAHILTTVGTTVGNAPMLVLGMDRAFGLIMPAMFLAATPAELDHIFGKESPKP